MQKTPWSIVKHSFRAALDSHISSNLIRESPRIQYRQFSTLEMANGKTDPIFWECTACGGRYVDVPMGVFIPPPPITQCIKAQTNASGLHVSSGSVNLATCDYVRNNHIIDLSERIANPTEVATALDSPVMNELSAPAYDRALMKWEGEHGRVSRQNGAVDAAYDEDNGEDCEFWMAECENVDCIYEGEHRQHQCAMAEVDEEPGSKASSLKRGLRFWRSVT